MTDFPEPGRRRRSAVAEQPAKTTPRRVGGRVDEILGLLEAQEADKLRIVERRTPEPANGNGRYGEGGTNRWSTVKAARLARVATAPQRTRPLVRRGHVEPDGEYERELDRPGHVLGEYLDDPSVDDPSVPSRRRPLLRRGQEPAYIEDLRRLGRIEAALDDGRPPAEADARPLRRHANAKHDKEERRFDTTALHGELHSTLLAHSDYIAHVEKYDYVWRSILKGDRVLDVGCGTDLPLLVAINRSQSQATKLLLREGGCYTGVDMNPLKQTGISWATLLGETDLTSSEGYQAALEAIPGNVGLNGEERDVRGYTLIVALEVIEHMEVDDGRGLLQSMMELLTPGGRIVLSTPVYDGKAMARNHIHEYYAGELAQLIESVGLRIEKRLGTFTSEPVIKPWLKANRPEWYELYMEAREFHSAAYMSGLMAPMHPDLSRNNVWVLRLRGDAVTS